MKPGPVQPSGAVPKPVAPAACVTVSRRPNSSAAPADGPVSANRGTTSRPGETSRGSATGTPPGTASQRSPAASASKNPSGASERRFSNVPVTRPMFLDTRCPTYRAPRTGRGSRGSVVQVSGGERVVLGEDLVDPGLVEPLGQAGALLGVPDALGEHEGRRDEVHRAQAEERPDPGADRQVDDADDRDQGDAERDRCLPVERRGVLGVRGDVHTHQPGGPGGAQACVRLLNSA